MRKYSITVTKCASYWVSVEAESLYDALEKAPSMVGARLPINEWTEEELNSDDPEFERLRHDPKFLEFLEEEFEYKKDMNNGLVDVNAMAKACFGGLAEAMDIYVAKYEDENGEIKKSGTISGRLTGNEPNAVYLPVTEKDFEEYLNKRDARIYPDRGTWLKENDPIGFAIRFDEYKREKEAGAYGKEDN